jgi:hypothetical protein
MESFAWKAINASPALDRRAFLFPGTIRSRARSLVARSASRYTWVVSMLSCPGQTVRGVDPPLAHLLRPGLLGDVIQDQIPKFQVVIHGIEFELAILKTNSPRPLLTRGVGRIEVGLSERH